MKKDDIVYHIANPAIAGKVLEISENWIAVKFENPVAFSGNKGRGFSDYWKCSKNLLFNSPEEALAADNKGNR